MDNSQEILNNCIKCPHVDKCSVLMCEAIWATDAKCADDICCNYFLTVVDHCKKHIFDEINAALEQHCGQLI